MNKKVFITDLKRDVSKNDFFRDVIYTSPNRFQIVLYKLEPGENIEREIHNKQIQLLYIFQGSGTLIIDHGKKSKHDPKIYDVQEGSLIIIPNGLYHHLINDGNIAMKFYSVYNPPEFEHERKDRNPN